MVQFGCHKRGKFLFHLQSFPAQIRVSGSIDVGSHIRAHRNQPLPAQGLTGSVAVTNILLQINASTYNAAHVGAQKIPSSAVGFVVGPAIDWPPTPGATPVIPNRSKLFVVNTSHRT
jgi:hypothetical protein